MVNLFKFTNIQLLYIASTPPPALLTFLLWPLKTEAFLLPTLDPLDVRFLDFEVWEVLFFGTVSQEMILDNISTAYHSVSINPCEDQLIVVGNERHGPSLFDLRCWKKYTNK